MFRACKDKAASGKPCPVPGKHYCAEDDNWRCTPHMEAFRKIGPKVATPKRRAS